MTLIVAHRGSHDIHRENSVAAFREAVTRGADGIELDLRRSRDGVGVIHHDAALADGRVIAETLAADLGADVCTLGDALDACAGAFVNIEIKNQLGEPGHDPDARVVEVLAVELERRPDAPSRWLISSFDATTLATARHRLPRVRTAYLTAHDPASALDTVMANGHPWWHPWDQTLHVDDVRRAHANGVGVTVWTCNDSSRMAMWMGAGVDAVCTDDVGTALNIRRQISAG
jgi:glycerophosphoryl diester phosphodiesterase